MKDFGELTELILIDACVVYCFLYVNIQFYIHSIILTSQRQNMS
jgi:hypothetical protein